MLNNLLVGHHEVVMKHPGSKSFEMSWIKSLSLFEGLKSSHVEYP